MIRIGRRLLSRISGESKRGLFAIGGFCCGLLVFPLIQAFTENRLNDLFTNLISEGVGIVFTVVIIDRITQDREEQKLKKTLLEHLGSRINSIAVSAAEDLWANGWWTDGSLKDAQIERADLRGVDFGKANLTGVRFSHPRYGNVLFDENTILPDETHWTPETDMKMFTDPNHPNYWCGFGLRGMRKIGIDLAGKNLRGADIRGCDLRRANLRQTNFIATRMEDCLLTGANLTGALFSPQTILPDGTNWVNETDLSRFGAIVESPEVKDEK